MLPVELRNIVPNSMTLDGMGFDPVPLRTAYLVAKEHNLADLFLPTGYDPDVEEGAQVLRSLFRFRFVVGTARDKVEDRVAASKVVDSKWEAFFTDVLVPALGSSDMVTSFKDDMHVWFDGTGFRDFEVYMAVINDVPLAIGSAVFILAYMLAHTRSLLLAVVGPLLAMLSVPITWIICGAILGNSTVNFANFLAVFLAIGFGADVMFVYYDAWTQSEGHAEQIPNRLAWTYQRAVKASLATTSTTALSFLCNMASVIRCSSAIRFLHGNLCSDHLAFADLHLRPDHCHRLHLVQESSTVQPTLDRLQIGMLWKLGSGVVSHSLLHLVPDHSFHGDLCILGFTSSHCGHRDARCIPGPA